MMELRALGRPGTDNSATSPLQDREGAKAVAARDELTPSNWKGRVGYVPRNLTLKHYAIKPFDVRANLEAD